MTRIPLVRPEDIPQAAREFVDRRGGLALYRLLANAPAVFVGWTRMAEEVLNSSTFSARMRELVVLRVAYLQGSSYEVGHHIVRGRRTGICQRHLDAVTSDDDLAAAGFDDTELAVLAFVSELCTTNRVSDESFASARSALGDDGIITELLILVSLYYGLALVLNAAELELDENARYESDTDPEKVGL